MADAEVPARPAERTDLHSPARHRIGVHYEVVDELGRGGMATVCRVIDTRSGKHVALKQLLPSGLGKEALGQTALFEREFHTLAQLAHPRVIEVYDYGVDAGGPYYTMELLDGGDLRDRSPLPFRDACELIFDVCSSLALLHSRRLVHRDVSPRNVRCTHDGHAKLIDFGAMIPMGSNAQAVGTPPFVAPEVVHATMLDARADLFSLGATLYFALTGQLAYPARSFAQLAHCWAIKPPPPSAIAPGVPPALDQLVMSLMSLEAAPRPRSAFEVMQRLASIAGIQRQEPLSVSKSYLVTPSLVARSAVLERCREALRRAKQELGGALLISGTPGRGRTRMLDACVLEAKTIGFHVVRAIAAGNSGHDLAGIRVLAQQLLDTAPIVAVDAARTAAVEAILFEPNAAAADSLPQLRNFVRVGRDRNDLANALVEWFLQASKRVPLLVTADDVERFDDASIALLATLAERAPSHALLVVATAARTSDPNLAARVSVLSGRCESLQLSPLDLDDTEQLLGSVFGDVPNLALLSTRIHARAGGEPREIMGLAQHLIDRGTIRYDGGSWSLPEQLTDAEMPANAAMVYRARIASLGTLARRLAETQALALDEQFTRADYALLEPAVDGTSLDAALSELLEEQLLTAHDGRSFRLDRAAVTVLTEELDDADRRARYRTLAERSERSGQHAVLSARLWLLCDEVERGLDMLLRGLRPLRDLAGATASGLSADELGRTLVRALHKALELERPPREVNDFRNWLTLLSVSCEDDLYWQVAPLWRQQLERDSGLIDYRELREITDPNERLMRALSNAASRHAAQPERERVYAPDEAIRLLAMYVALSIAESSRGFNGALVASLPALLEPFAPLSPLIAAIWQNAIAACESIFHRQSERASQRWIDVYERLGKIEGADPEIVSSIRYAVAYGVGVEQATLGMESALGWVKLLDADPMQRVNAMYLRKVMCLQQGDLEGAERWRKHGELLALQSNGRQMFTTLLTLELAVHAAAWDLTGVKQLGERIEARAERYRGWLPFRHLAHAYYRRLLGDLEAAREAYLRALEVCAPDPKNEAGTMVAWPPVIAGLADTLIALGRPEDAYTIAMEAVRESERRGMRATAFDIVRVLGLAEAKLGDYARGAARIDGLIEQQLALGISGLGLGGSYESRARIAIWAGDRAAVERFAGLAAKQFRHGCGSTLGARYERLVEEARSSGVRFVPQLSAFESTILDETQVGRSEMTAGAVSDALHAASSSEERAARALEILCKALDASGGHLFLADGPTLRLAASSGDDPPNELLQQFASDFWAEQTDDDDDDVETAALTESALGPQRWSDARGTVYRPVLLRGRFRSELRLAGIVVLVEGGTANNFSAKAVEVITEVARLLLEQTR
jgi:hypothetical protein